MTEHVQVFVMGINKYYLHFQLVWMKEKNQTHLVFFKKYHPKDSWPLFWCCMMYLLPFSLKSNSTESWWFSLPHSHFCVSWENNSLDKLKTTTQRSHFHKDKHIFVKSAVTEIVNLSPGSGTRSNLNFDLCEFEKKKFSSLFWCSCDWSQGGI